jgi:hypothetical protein
VVRNISQVYLSLTSLPYKIFGLSNARPSPRVILGPRRGLRSIGPGGEAEESSHATSFDKALFAIIGAYFAQWRLCPGIASNWWPSTG